MCLCLLRVYKSLSDCPQFCQQLSTVSLVSLHVMPRTDWQKAKRLLRKYNCENATELLTTRIKKWNWVLALSSVSLAATGSDHAFYIDMDHSEIAPYKMYYSTQLFLSDSFPALDKVLLHYVAINGWDPVDPVCVAYHALATKIASPDVRVIVLDRDNEYIMSVPRLLADLRFRLLNLPGDMTYTYECSVCLEKVRYLNNDMYNCVHSFCMNCVKSFMEKLHNVCPLCRAEKRENCNLVVGDINPEIRNLVSALEPHRPPR